MPIYQAPLGDIKFLLHDFLGLGETEAPTGDEPETGAEAEAETEPDGEPGTEPETTSEAAPEAEAKPEPEPEPDPEPDGLSQDVMDAVLEGAARIAEDVLQPLNQSGDTEGCSFENGVVRTPAGFKDAYDQYCAGGWNALSVSEKWGGQGLPPVLALAVTEMMVSANHAFSTYPGLTSAVIGALSGFAPDEIKRRYLPKLVSGAWSGTMNLTEPHCGTDLGLMRTKAVAQDDGSYLVSGTKCFITAGDHDLTDNIVHMVLAKLDGAGDDLSAVRLFLVPKFLVGEDGEPGERNGVSCGGIESKMGIRGSATALLNYDQAVGFLIGSPPAPKPAAGEDKSAEADPKPSRGRGMAGMFAMMNAARLGVGLQGLALAEVAYQNAANYAYARLAGRALTGPKYPDRPADPIIVHPDVRRMLLEIRSFTEGARALVMWLAAAISDARDSGDAERSAAAAELAGLLTPVIKAHFTDRGFECTNLALQVYGGHGYIKDHGMEQFVRDARILQLYEGANGVQALDLVGRRLPANQGRASRRFFADLAAYLDANKRDAAMTPFIRPLKQGYDRLVGATMWLAENGIVNRNDAGAGASDYLRLFGVVAIGLMWSQMAEVARARLAEEDCPDPDFYRMKLTCARFYMDRIMPETAMLEARVAAGGATLMEPDDTAF